MTAIFGGKIWLLVAREKLSSFKNRYSGPRAVSSRKWILDGRTIRYKGKAIHVKKLYNSRISICNATRCEMCCKSKSEKRTTFLQLLLNQMGRPFYVASGAI